MPQRASSRGGEAAAASGLLSSRKQLEAAGQHGRLQSEHVTASLTSTFE